LEVQQGRGHKPIFTNGADEILYTHCTRDRPYVCKVVGDLIALRAGWYRKLTRAIRTDLQDIHDDLVDLKTSSNVTMDKIAVIKNHTTA
jgi:hypothetical protein